MDLIAVESFIAVTRERHFGRAAQSLDVSVSALSKRLQRLENELGVPLVLRDSGGFLGLTPAGERFIRFAPKLLRAAQAATQAAVGGAATTLRLAVPAGVGVVAPLMPTAVATLELALSHAHPGTAIETVPTPFPHLTENLLDGEVDAVLTFGRSAREGVASTELSQIHRVGMVAANHPLGSRSSVEVAEFAKYPMIYGAGLPDEYMHPFVLADVRPLSEANLVPIDASNTAHVAQRVLRGREVTVVPLALTGNLPRSSAASSCGTPRRTGITRTDGTETTDRSCSRRSISWATSPSPSPAQRSPGASQPLPHRKQSELDR